MRVDDSRLGLMKVHKVDESTQGWWKYMRVDESTWKFDFSWW